MFETSVISRRQIAPNLELQFSSRTQGQQNLIKKVRQILKNNNGMFKWALKNILGVLGNHKADKIITHFRANCPATHSSKSEDNT